MKKRDLKKLALLGLTGGIMLGSQSVVANEAESSGTLIAHSGCGANSCNNQPSGPKGARNSRTTNGCAAPNQKTTNSCNANREASNCNSQNGPRNSCNSYFRNARNGGQSDEVAEADEKVSNPGKLTESDLLDQLNEQSKSLYLSLSPEGKALALKLANQNCKGQNDCKGLNSCKSSENSCAGKGACKGKSQCAFKDKNLAVKVAAKKMAEKRSGLSQ